MNDLAHDAICRSIEASVRINNKCTKSIGHTQEQTGRPDHLFPIQYQHLTDQCRSGPPWEDIINIAPIPFLSPFNLFCYLTLSNSTFLVSLKIMSPPQDDQEKASTSILKERRFKLSRSVVSSLSLLIDLLTPPYLRACDRCRSVLALSLINPSLTTLKSKENQMR